MAKKKEAYIKSVDVAAMGRYDTEESVHRAIRSLRWLAKDESISEEDRGRFAEALQNLKRIQKLIKSTIFPDPKSVLWLRKQPRKRK